MFYITLSITLLEFSQLSTKEISRYTKRTRTTRSFQTTSQPHDPKQESTHNNTDNNKKKHNNNSTIQNRNLLVRSEWLLCPLHRVVLLPSVRRHGRRCVQNCSFFGCLQRRAGAIEQTHFGSTAQKQSCQASQGVESCQKLFRSSIWFFHFWGERIIRRLGATPLWCVKFGVCGSSARTSEVLPTCGCLLKRTCRSLEKNFCSEFRHSLTKSSHAAIPHVHFYEVILGEVWEATWNRTSKSFVYVATEALRPEGAGPWSDAS